MTDLEAIKARHSVRKYVSQPLCQELVDALQQKITECNNAGRLNIQLVVNEQKAFAGMHSYGKFEGVENYIVMVGEKAADLDYRIGYYGEKLVLYAQQLGLNTCWVGLTYKKVAGCFAVADGEKVACVIAVGYGESEGQGHKIKPVNKVSNCSDATPEWFRQGVEAALLAPTAVNQQKFYFEYVAPANGEKAVVKARKQFSLVGYAKIDLGIACLHFEIGAGRDNFEWG